MGSVRRDSRSARSSPCRRSPARSSRSRPVRLLFAQPAFTPLILGLVAITLLWGMIGAFLPIFGKEHLRLAGAQVGYLIAIQAVANGAARIPAGSIADRARHRWPLVFVGVLAWGAACVVIGHLDGLWEPALLLVVATPFMA